MNKQKENNIHKNQEAEPSLPAHNTEKIKLSKITQEKLLWILPPVMTAFGMWIIVLVSIFTG